MITPMNGMSTVEWANQRGASLPRMVTGSPGPMSHKVHARMNDHLRGTYTRMVALHPVAFESGEGIMLRDVDGNEYIDFSSGIVITSLGHAHPRIAKAIGDAAAELVNVHDFAHPRKVEAMELLASVTPEGMTLVNFFSAGTEAVEGAMRVARAKTGKHGFFSFYNDFHGRTTASASVSAALVSNGIRAGGSHLVPSGHCYRSPVCQGADHAQCAKRSAALLEQAIVQNGAGMTAGVVMEIITNGNGATVFPDGYVAEVADVCRRHGVMLIADEVATAMGRTGAWFASNHYDLVPDVMCIGKGLGNGFPVTAIAVREEHAEALAASFPSTSYGGNPMACAAVIESITIMRDEGIPEHARRLGDFALAQMEQLQEAHPIIGEVRGKGGLLAIELVKDRSTREPFPEAGDLVYQTAFGKGLSWATAGHILRITPPIVMSTEVFAKGLDIIDESLTEVERHFGYA